MITDTTPICSRTEHISARKVFAFLEYLDAVGVSQSRNILPCTNLEASYTEHTKTEIVSISLHYHNSMLLWYRSTRVNRIPFNLRKSIHGHSHSEVQFCAEGQ
jgi:hypothetical protein